VKLDQKTKLQNLDDTATSKKTMMCRDDKLCYFSFVRSFTMRGVFLSFRLLALIALAILLALVPARAASQERRADANSCSESWDTVRTPKKKAKNAPNVAAGSAACVELAASALDVQEYLQAYARGQHWIFADENVGEDSWSFSIPLSREQLLGDTKPSPERVEWRSGIAMIQVRSTSLPNGLTRTIIRGRFRGYGEAADQFAMKREYWELASNGSFEAALASALKTRFKQNP
jgi:hypothetical protein